MPEEGTLSSFVSRKFILAIISIIIMTLFAYLGLSSTVTVSVLPILIGGILGVLSLYFAGNIVGSKIASKTEKKEKPEAVIVEETGEEK